MSARRRRRGQQDDRDNHERWLVSYADFITLLFAFFVVMYAISSVNEGKYRVLSSSLVTAFRSPETSAGGALAPVVQVPQISTIRPNLRVKPPAQVEREQRAEEMKSVARNIVQAMRPFSSQGQVAVIESDRGVAVEINDSLLFSAGRADLAPRAEQAILAVGQVIAETPYPVTIEGHTDNIPIRTPLFPSNWELSAVRATTVLRVLAAAGVAPQRLTAIGYGDQRPVESNESDAGRSRNRRVAIQLEAAVPPVPATPQFSAPAVQ